MTLARVRHARHARLAVTLSGLLVASGVTLIVADPQPARAAACDTTVGVAGSSIGPDASGNATIPAGITAVHVVATGGPGGRGFSGDPPLDNGGAGAVVTTDLAIPAGTLQVTTGSSGVDGSASTPGAGGVTAGFPSGGAGAHSTSDWAGAGGGGATFVSSGGTVLVAAGGGGGGGAYPTSGGDAATGTTAVAAGAVTSGGSAADAVGNEGGVGATSTPGPGGTSSNDASADGKPGSGNVGGSAQGSDAGGGGGGYAGGGGGADIVGGGAGSSFSVAAYTISPGSTAGFLIRYGAPSITSSDTVTFTRGTASSFTVCAPGAPAPAITTSSSLPAGVTLTDNHDGTATLAYGGTDIALGSTTIALTAHNGNGTDATQNLGISVVQGPATHLAFQLEADVVAGQSSGELVQALDSFGHVVPGFTDTVRLTTSDPHSVLPSDHAFVAADAGQFSFALTQDTAGQQNLTATDLTTNAVSAATGQQTVEPAAPDHLVVAPPSPQVSAGVAQHLTHVVRDVYGNAELSTYPLASIAISPNGSCDAAAETCTATTVGAHTITETVVAGGTTLSATSSMTVTPAAVAAVVLSAPATADAGTPVSAKVTAEDQYANTVTGYTGTVHLTSSDAHAILPGSYTFTAADAGVHTFAVTFATGGAQTLLATDTTSVNVTGTSITTTVRTKPGAPTVRSVTPADGRASVSFTPPTDDGGLPITGYTAYAVGGGRTVTATGTGSPLTITGLTDGITYSVTVVATNAVGSGSASAIRTTTPLAASALAAMTAAPLRVTSGQGVRLRGQVVEDGRPVGAGVAVTVTRTGRSGPSTVVGHALTAADGTFTLTVKPTRDSAYVATALVGGIGVVTKPVAVRVLFTVGKQRISYDRKTRRLVASAVIGPVPAGAPLPRVVVYETDLHRSRIHYIGVMAAKRHGTMVTVTINRIVSLHGTLLLGIAPLSTTVNTGVLSRPVKVRAS